MCRGYTLPQEPSLRLVSVGSQRVCGCVPHVRSPTIICKQRDTVVNIVFLCVLEKQVLCDRVERMLPIINSARPPPATPPPSTAPQFMIAPKGGSHTMFTLTIVLPNTRVRPPGTASTRLPTARTTSVSFECCSPLRRARQTKHHRHFSGQRCLRSTHQSACLG